MKKYISLPLEEKDIENLKSGDIVYLNGIMYTARDAAHQKMEEVIKSNGKLPFDLKGNCIYYMGPSPARENKVIGSAGPTTSGRMDKYTPELLRMGLKGVVGKGKRSKETEKSFIKNKAIYFAAVGGAGALLSKSIISSEIIAYEELGTEAVRKIEVKDFPVIVIIDTLGNNLYEMAKDLYSIG